MPDFAKRLRFIRCVTGRHQTEIAAWLNITRAAVGQWESGKCEPNTDTIRVLAGCFGIEPGWFLAPWKEVEEEWQKKYDELLYKADWSHKQLDDFVLHYWFMDHIRSERLQQESDARALAARPLSDEEKKKAQEAAAAADERCERLAEERQVAAMRRLETKLKEATRDAAAQAKKPTP